MKLKGLPDPVELYDYLVSEGCRVFLCELLIENKGLEMSQPRNGIEVVGVPSFLMEAQDVGLSLSF